MKITEFRYSNDASDFNYHIMANSVIYNWHFSYKHIGANAGQCVNTA